MTTETLETAQHHDEHHDHKMTGFKRWLYTTNHKDIGTMYLILAVVGGTIGGLMSMAMRAELMYPGLQIFVNPVQHGF